MRHTALLSILLLTLIVCQRSDNHLKKDVGSGNSSAFTTQKRANQLSTNMWNYDTSVITATGSDWSQVDEWSDLTFYASGQRPDSPRITFRFLGRPTVDSTYLIQIFPMWAHEVGIVLERSSNNRYGPYGEIAGATAKVKFINGKLNISNDSVLVRLMNPDIIDSSYLHFNLTEF